MLKIRASYGRLANQNTSNWYPTYTALGIVTASGGWMFNGSRPNIATALGTLVDEFLTWEKVGTTNLGLDLSMIGNRLTGSFDIFKRQTKDMLGPAPERPAILGVGVPRMNNTDLTDKGFEFQVMWRDVLKNGLGYGVRFTLADHMTTIDKYPNPTGSLSTYIEGRHTGEIWGLKTLGIAKTQEEMDAHLAKVNQDALGSKWGAGDIMYDNVSGTGKINSGSNTINDHGDLVLLGNSTPRFRYGMEFTLDYKGFDIRAFFQGVGKKMFGKEASISGVLLQICGLL